MAIILHLLVEFLAEDKILANIFIIARTTHRQAEGSSESLHCSRPADTVRNTHAHSAFH